MLCSPSVLWILTCIYRGDLLLGFPNSTRMVMCMEIRHILYRIGLAISVPVLPISDAVHCNRSCSALQPPLQCTASVLAVHCILQASTSNLSRKYVHPSPQVRATVLASTSEIGSFRNLPRVFLLSPVFFEYDFGITLKYCLLQSYAE